MIQFIYFLNLLDVRKRKYMLKIINAVFNAFIFKQHFIISYIWSRNIIGIDTIEMYCFKKMKLFIGML